MIKFLNVFVHKYILNRLLKKIYFNSLLITKYVFFFAEMALASKLKLSLFYDIISPHCLPIFTEISKDVVFKNVKLDLKPIIGTDVESELNTSTDYILSYKYNDVKLINSLYKFNMTLFDNWIEIWLGNKMGHVQNFLANLTSSNKTNQNDLIKFNLELLRLFWIDKNLNIDKNTLENLVKNFTNLNTDFDYTNNMELKKNIEISSNENVIETPFFILTAPKNCRYIFRGYESIPLIKNEINLQISRLNTVICNL